MCEFNMYIYAYGGYYLKSCIFGIFWILNGFVNDHLIC